MYYLESKNRYGTKGLEPLIFYSQSRRVNQLGYAPQKSKIIYLNSLTPYFERFLRISCKGAASKAPRWILYRTPGQSRWWPPFIRTDEYFWILWPWPCIYAVTKRKFVKRTLATLRNAEFGFLGDMINTFKQCPRFCGAPSNAGVRVFL